MATAKLRSHVLKHKPSIDYLHDCFILRRDGTLLWKERPREHFSDNRVCNNWNSKNAGTKAGTLSKISPSSRYFRIGINGKKLMAHVIVWAMTTGKWPREEIDHRDGDGTNNRFSNLREASHAEGGQNAKLRIDNQSGFRHCWCRKSGRWSARISVRMKLINLGTFDTPEEAYDAYLAARKLYYRFQPEPRV